jgi:hypothetical protein
MIRRGYIHRTFQGKAQAAGRTEPALNVLPTNNRCQIGLADHRARIAGHQIPHTRAGACKRTEAAIRNVSGPDSRPANPVGSRRRQLVSTGQAPNI